MGTVSRPPVDHAGQPATVIDARAKQRPRADRQPQQRAVGEGRHRCEWIDRLAVKHLAAHDVSDPRHDSLVEQHLGHRPINQPRTAQVFAGVEATVQEVRPQPWPARTAPDAKPAHQYRVPRGGADHRTVECGGRGTATGG